MTCRTRAWPTFLKRYGSEDLVPKWRLAWMTEGGKNGGDLFSVLTGRNVTPDGP